MLNRKLVEISAHESILNVSKELAPCLIIDHARITHLGVDFLS